MVYLIYKIEIFLLINYGKKLTNEMKWWMKPSKMGPRFESDQEKLKIF